VGAPWRVPGNGSGRPGQTCTVARHKYTMRRPVSLDQVSRKLRPAPAPLEANDQLVTAVITAAWAIGLITVLVLRDSLPAGQRWWVWVCAVGVCMGLFGLWYVPRLKRARARSAQRRAQAGDRPDES
jgi:Flp pilus assembly protein TadB